MDGLSKFMKEKLMLFEWLTSHGFLLGENDLKPSWWVYVCKAVLCYDELRLSRCVCVYKATSRGQKSYICCANVKSLPALLCIVLWANRELDSEALPLEMSIEHLDKKKIEVIV